MSEVSPPPDLPFQFQINEARTEVEIPINGPSAKLTTKQVDDVIRLLGLIRATMKPPVVLDVPPKDNLPLTPATNWRVFRFDPDKPCQIALRTDGYGWLLLVLDPNGREALVNTLTGKDIGPPTSGATLQ